MVGLSGQGPWMRLLVHPLLNKSSLMNLMKLGAHIMLFVLKMAIKFDLSLKYILSICFKKIK
jgi:hypothetical protein